jgi:pimeloyl-ACP methyl ester carboxylesterase
MFVELRVHGVSGTPPVEMLDHPLVKQVAGDADGRFFRPVDSAGEEIRAADGHVLEGYHWGPLTSGSWRQALWLVLIPFGLVNAAHFMLPDGGGTAARAVARAALRVLAVVLTGLVALSLAQAAVDLVAWQWTGVAPRSGDPRWWLAGAVVSVVAVLLVVRFIGGPPRTPPAGAAVPPPGVPSGLAGGEFYTGDQDLRALRHLHLTAGLTVLSVLTGSLARTHGGLAWPYWAAVGLLVWSVVHTALIGDPTAGRSGLRALFAVRLPVVVLVLGVVLLAVAAGAMLAVPDYPATRRGVLPGTAGLGLWAAGLTLAALLVLVAAAAVLAARTGEPGAPRPFRRFLGGMTGPVVAVLGTFLGVGFTAALAYGVLRLLRPAGQQDAMALPVFHVRIAFASGVAVALAVVLALVLAGWLARSRRRYTALVRASAGPDVLPEEEVRAVARAWWAARLKFSVHWLAITVAAAGTVLTVAAVAEAVADLDAVTCRPGGTWLSDCRDLPGPDLVSIGTVALLLVGGFLVYLGRRAVGDSAVRRAACVVWDVVAFWPAAAHPFVPPPYSPKVIEDLRRRIEWHLADPATTVVLAGHSQGSLIAAAALTRLPARCRSRVALLTYGSQLQIAYARAFPAYVSHRFLCWLHDEVLDGRWVSLYRETDPIGGPVLSWDRSDGPEFTSRRLGGTGVVADETDPRTGVRRCGSEWRLLDPCPADGHTAPRLAMLRHSSYSTDPVWAAALAELTGRYPRSATTASAARRPETSAP